MVKRAEQQRVFYEYEPQFKTYTDRAHALGWNMNIHERRVDVAGIGVYDYTSEGLGSFITRLEDEEKFQSEQAIANAEKARIAADPALTDFGGHYREMGATNQVNYWVVRADGTLRDDEKTWRRYESEGQKKWGAVGKDEIALKWEKYDVASGYSFEVFYCPSEGITPEQLSSVKAIEGGIAERWSVYDYRADDPRGDRSSPPIGRGWGLSPESQAETAKHEAIKQQLYTAQDVLREITGVDGLRQDYQNEAGILQRRIESLQDVRVGEVRDYENQVKSILGLVRSLKNKVDAWTASMETGSVTTDALQALQRHFKNKR